MPMAAQERGGQRAGAPAPAAPAMTMTIPGFSRWRTDSREIQPGGRRRRAGRGDVTGDQLGQSAGRNAVVRAQHARHGRRPQQDHGRSGALGRVEHSGDGHRLARRRSQGLAIAGRQLSNQRHRSRCIAALAHRRTVRRIITCSSSSPLDTKLDVQPTADAFETRANVLKAMQGHILGKAVYGGLFRRPQ